MLLISSFISLCSEHILCMVSVFLNLLTLDLWPNICSVVENVLSATGRKYAFCCCWLEDLCMSVRSSWFIVLFKFSISIMIFYLIVLSLLKVGCWGTSLVAQWLRIRLPMQGTQIWSLVQEDPTCRRTHVPQLLSLCSRAHEPQLLSLCATTTEAHTPRAHDPQQEKPLQWETCAPQRRVTPACRNQREPARSNEDPTQPKIN